MSKKSLGLDVRLELEGLISNDDTIRSEKDGRQASIFRVAELDARTEADNLRSIIHQSAREGNVNALQEALLKAPLAVNAQDGDFMTPLHYAARYGNYDAVKLLLSKNALPNTKNREGDTPLHIASKYIYGYSDICSIIDEDQADSARKYNTATKKIINALVSENAEIDPVNKYQLTPLHYAAMKSNFSALHALIKLKADVDAEDDNKMTPLLLACVHGSQEIIQELIKANSNVTKRDQRLNTVFHIVALRGEPEYLEMMMDHDPVEAIKALNLFNNEKKTPLRMAVEGNHPETLKKILQMEKKNSCKWMDREKELIHFAAEKGFLEVLKALVEAGGNKNELNEVKAVPLHVAAQMNQLEVVSYLIEEEKDNIDVVDEQGLTPLMMAVTHDSKKCVEYLIAKKANLTITDKDERTPVFIGAKFNALSSVEYILDHLRKKNKETERSALKSPTRNTLRIVSEDVRRTMVNMVDRDQNTPMHIVASNGYLEMMQLLQKHGASITQVNEDEETALHRAAIGVRQLLEWDIRLLLMKDEMGNSALHLAARSGHDATTKVLLDNGADKEAKNSYQKTPLQVAVDSGKLETCQRLVAKGAQIESSSDTKTVLHTAAFYGNESIVRYFIAEGVTIDRRDEEGKTAFDIACENDHKDVARAFLETDQWKNLMIPCDVIPLDKHRNPVNMKRRTPFRTLLTKFPELASFVMDNCIEKSKEETDSTQSVAYNFEFLDDTYMMRCVSDDGTGEQLIGCKSAYDEDFKLEKDAQSYASNYDRVYKYHPLKLMADAEKLHLLNHPLSKALLKYKWNRLGRPMYYFALFMYLVFIVSLTQYVRHTKAPYNVWNEESYYDSEYFDENETCPQINTTKPDVVWKIIIQTLAVCQILVECFQLFQRKFAYLVNWENWIDCFIYSTALITVYDFSECSATSGVRQNWQWILAALCIFFGWINLLFMIRKMPRFGIFVVMFVDIVKTFFRFFPVFVLFIIAFSSSFYVILQNRPEFSTIFMSPLKTTVMMIGEFEFTGIFHGDETTHAEKMFGPAHTAVACALFFFFCIIMTILLMNLLVGLAVDDIKGVQEKAELKRLAMQVDLVLQIEASLHFFIQRTKKYATCRYATFPYGKLHKTGFAGWWSNFRRRFGLSVSTDPEIDEMYEREAEFTSEMTQKLQNQAAKLKNIQENIDVMYEKQVRLEAIIAKLATGLNINIELEEKDN
uniref:Transient receptor potential subfamily A-1 n=1 Tax=Caenorhabditis elegans TaxID=6239 RepID=A5HJZ7_CAEEL|nr:transient receptor potential subfamily A-1 [Caenorhabditis elegans]